MTWLVQPRLVNDPFSDPALFIDFRFGRRALLFDLGDLSALSPGEIRRVSHVFVSHTHMDHFAGFDHLLRICLHQPRPIHLFGPPGFNDRVEHKLRAYTWNLLDESVSDFSLVSTEFGAEGLHQSCEFRAREAFHRRGRKLQKLRADVLLEEEEFRVVGTVLDHGTPCLAFAFEEKMRINVWKEGLAALNLPVGRWLNSAKRAVRRRAPDDHEIIVSEGVTVPLGLLKARALRIATGQKIAYVVDAAYGERNIAKITVLAGGAEQLFIEAAFLQEHAALAAERRHLTAFQAGTIARRAAAAAVVPLHFSARYVDREDQLRREVEAAFRGC